jgi:hypothetical protein
MLTRANTSSAMALPMVATALSLDRIRQQGWPQHTILSSVLRLILYATIFNVNEGVALFPLQLLFCKFFVVVTVVVGSLSTCPTSV